MAHRPIKVAVPGLLLLLIALAWPAPARARAILLRSAPADGAVLAVGPESLQLWFDHAAVVEPAAVSVTDAAGAAVPLAGVKAESYQPADAGLGERFDATYLFLCSLGLGSYPTRLSVALPALRPGAYRLSWRAIAVDDRRETAGTLVFVVDPSAPAAASAAPAASYSGVSDDVLVSLAVRPNRPGANFLGVRIVPVRRPLVAPIGQVRMRLTGPSGVTQEVAARQAPDGTFLVASDLIDRPGRWSAEIRVARGPRRETSVPISWDVPAAASQPPVWAQPLAEAAAGLGAVLVLWWAERRSF